MYIKRIRKQWYAIHDIPRSLRESMGKVRFCQTLRTEDQVTAKRRAAVLEVRWRGEIERAKKENTSKDVDYWRGIWQASSPEERELVGEMLADELDNKIHRAATQAGLEYADQDELATLPEYQEAARTYAIVTGKVAPLSTHLEDYLATLGDKEPKSLDMKRSTILKFSKAFPFTDNIHRKEVQAWINELTNEGKKTDTIRRYLSELRGYWGYLQSLEVVSDDNLPFEKLTIPKARRAAANDSRQAFTPEEVVSLLKAAEERKDHQLADLIRLGMWTGARIEELCALKTKDVFNGYFKIADAKTKAGVRQVPIHSKLKPIMDRLVKDSADGYVLSDLTPNKYGNRSNAIGKRFGRLKKAMGHPETLVFHSIRKTVATLLENAGVPENHAADIIGHEKKSMTYGLYSGGGYLQTLARELEKIDYPIP